MNKLVENLDPEIWRQFTGIAKFQNKKVGNLLNDILFVFIEKQKIKSNNHK